MANDVLNTATQGLQTAERRALDVAERILRAQTASNSGTLSNADRARFGNLVPSQNGASVPSQEGIDEQSGAPIASGPGRPIANPLPITAMQGNSLPFDIAELKASETAFKASATAFRKIDETLDTMINETDDNGT